MPRTSAKDDLKAYVTARSRRDPEFAALLRAAEERHRVLSQLGAARRAAGLSRTAVAARMGTSEAMIVRLEKGESDAKLSTLQRFALSLDLQVEFTLRPMTRTRSPAKRR